MSMKRIQGLHHITAVAKDPQINVDFYRQVLGQRLVKTTVNFDDPGTYHFYYGDEVGTPGTIMTFFPWRHVGKGRVGNGETAAVAYGVRPEAIGFWRDYLARQGVTAVLTTTRFGADVLTFTDPDGMQLELVASTAPAAFRFWEQGPIPESHTLLGFHGVTLWLDEVEATAQLLTAQLGYQFVGQENGRYRYQAADDSMGVYVDILQRPGGEDGRFGAGSIHHIAFRTVDDSEQLDYLRHLQQAGYRVTPVQDRQYFHSIYFRSPGGVLFEIATDAPGFAIDELIAELGDRLQLPAWFAAQRQQIEAALPSFVRKPIVKAEVVHE